MRDQPPHHDGEHGVPAAAEELLADAIELDEAGDAEAVDRLLAAHPEHATLVRRLLESLQDRGLVGDAVPGGVPDRLGGYELLRPLGQGGMGRVYLARQVAVHRLVAVKVIHPALASNPAIAKRFRQEAEAAARVRHPNVVTIFEAGEDAGCLYLAMELVPGRSLDRLLAEAEADDAQTPTADVVRWGRDVARGLAAVHEAGIVHRDVKPSNVVITTEGHAVLLDFGLAKDVLGETVTQTGAFQGSPQFASPEQVDASGGAVGPKSDVFSLGATLYRALGGRLPFDGGTTEQVFHQILTRETLPLRRVRASAPKDLETVVAKAMRKRPEDRYESANDLADDLDAVLQFRPVRARPLGVAARATRWARRNRALTAACAAVAVLLLSLPVVLIVQAHRDEQEARRLVAEARDLLGTYRELKARSAEVDGEVPAILRERESRYLDDEQEARLRARESALVVTQEQRNLALSEILARLDRAERLAGDLPGISEVRAHLFLEKLREAESAGDTVAVAFFGRLLESHDTSGRLRSEIRGTGEVVIESDPPGAEVHLFRYRDLAELEPDGEHRLVPVPVSGRAPLAPGRRGLRVIAASGDLRVGDLVIALEGHDIDAPDAAARAMRGGITGTVLARAGTRRMSLPPDSRLVATSAAMPLTAGTRSGVTPLRQRLETGTYMAVLMADGHERLRCPLSVGRDSRQRHVVRLLPAGTSPEGFVYVTGAGSTSRGADAPAAPADPPDFWMQRREVTCAEYLEFLNDPATLRRLDAATTTVFVPRGQINAKAEDRWPRLEGGAYGLPPGTDPRLPVLGVSCRDAMAFAAWWTARAGDGFSYSLPVIWDWQRAALGPGARRYVFGNRFRPRWYKSLHARPGPEPGPEPVLGFPLDESPFGIFDMTGSAREHCENFFWPEKRWRTVVGSSWAKGREIHGRILHQDGYHEDSVTSDLGFRLKAVRRP